MGRPTKPQPRCKQLNLSLTESELEVIRRRAEAVGMRPVHFARALVIDPVRAPVLKRSEDTHITQLVYGQLVRLGNNLNQMARHCHRTGEPLPADQEPLLDDIRQMIARVPQ